jgi:hypothetical protein
MVSVFSFTALLLRLFSRPQMGAKNPKKSFFHAVNAQAPAIISAKEISGGRKKPRPKTALLSA